MLRGHEKVDQNCWFVFFVKNGNPYYVFLPHKSHLADCHKSTYDAASSKIAIIIIIIILKERCANMKERIIQEILDKKVISIVRGVVPEKIIKIAEALYEGGVTLIEVTFNQKDPSSWVETASAIAAIRDSMGDKMFVGAGTVTSVELTEKAHKAGAQFIVSPNMDPVVIKRTVELGMVSMPGAMTPTEIFEAHRAGADFVKVFPAGTLGAAHIKAIRGPLNHIRLLAVGGVSEKNAAEFMKAGCAGLGVGGNLVNKEWIANGEFDKITALAKELCENATV